MQPIRTKLALKIGAVVLGALCASNTYADTFTATINTIEDVTITPRAGEILDFGPNMFVDAASTCTLQVGAGASTEAPGGLLMNYARTTDAEVARGANYGKLDGDCVTTATDSSAGVWDIAGAAGGAVSILISEIAQTPSDFTFTPQGCYVDYDGLTTADGDDCLAFTPGIVITGATLAAAASGDLDTAGVGSGATPIAAQLSIAVGGTVTVGAVPLDPSQQYDLSFQIDVTY